MWKREYKFNSPILYIFNKSENGELDFVYHHMNQNMQIKTGKCHSVPTVQENGKIELSEKWQWTSGDYSKGKSLLVEV